MLTSLLVAAIALACVALLLEVRTIRKTLQLFSRARLGVASVAELVAFEDAVDKAWEALLRAEEIRMGEEDFKPEERARLAVERYRAKRYHDRLLLRLNQARQADADFHRGRKTLEQIFAEFEPSFDAMSPILEERRIYEEALKAAMAEEE